MKIEEKPKFATPFEWIGGEAHVKALIERFYDLILVPRRMKDGLVPGTHTRRAVALWPKRF